MGISSTYLAFDADPNGSGQQASQSIAAGSENKA